MRSSTKLKDWLEVVGIFSVVVSLVFVGLEMRQARQISLSQAYQSRVASVVEWNTAFAANPAALSAQRKATTGHEDEITGEEYDAFRSTMIAVFHLYDNAYYQFQKGFVPEQFWQMTRNSLKRQMMNPVARDILVEKANHESRSAFRAVVLEIDDELGKD